MDMGNADEDLFVRVLNCLDSFAFLLSPDGEIQFANDAAYKFLPTLTVRSTLETYFPANAASEHRVLRKLFLQSPERQRQDFVLNAEDCLPALRCSLIKLELSGKCLLLELISKFSENDTRAENSNNFQTSAELLSAKHDKILAGIHDLKGHLQGSNRLFRQTLDGDFGKIELSLAQLLEKMINGNDSVLLLLQNLISLLCFDGLDSSNEMQVLNLSSFLNSILKVSVYSVDDCNIAEELYVLAHPPSMQSLFSNLLDNAKKFGGQKTRIQVELVQDGDFAVLSVKNTNSSLTADEQSKIFGKYWQAGKDADLSGFGLGLYLCKMIAHTHEAEISCQSADTGTEFRVMIPLIERN